MTCLPSTHVLGYDCSALRAGTSTTVGRWVPHTFAGFECVGDQESSDPRLVDAKRCGRGRGDRVGHPAMHFRSSAIVIFDEYPVPVRLLPE